MMLKTKLSPSFQELSPASGLYRHVGAIASLVLISVLSSSDGAPVQHTITNVWEGLIWGIADPVISLDRLALLVIIGLISAGLVRNTLIVTSFVLFSFLGTLMNLSPIYLPGVQVAIAIALTVFGAILVIPNRLHWLVFVAVTAITAFFQGYAEAEPIIGAEIVTLVTYVLGVALTQSLIIMSAREIGRIVNMGEVYQSSSPKIRWAGWGFCAVGVIFLGYSTIF